MNGFLISLPFFLVFPDNKDYAEAALSKTVIVDEQFSVLLQRKACEGFSILQTGN